MEKKKGGELICMRPDSIVEARFNLTRRQNDILDMVFATIENDDKYRYDVDVHKYAELYNLKDKSSIYSEIKKAVKSFEGKGFAITQKISEKKENRVYFSWFSSIEYCDGEGKIIVELGQRLKGLMLEVKRAIYYKLEYSINFKCIYSKRLYFYLKLYEDTGIRFDNLDELRNKLECPKSYQKYSLFRKNVLEPAYEEINGNSDISFEYEEVKTKNKVTAINFKIKTNKPKISNKSLLLPNNKDNEVCATKEGKCTNEEEKCHTELINKVKSVFKENIKAKEAEFILNIANGDINIVKEKYDIISHMKKVDSVVATMIDAIRKDYQAPKGKEKVGSFNDYEQRSYDFTELERQLLGWDKDDVGAEFQQLSIK